jgi:DNA-binding transcriptional MerR regulator
MDLLSTTAVCRFAGISYRQLDYWCRMGLVRPERDARGSGTQRKFTAAQARAVRLAAALMRLGATTGVISGLVTRMAEAPEWEWTGTIVVGHDGMVIDGPVDVAGWVVNLDAVAGRERLLASA